MKNFKIKSLFILIGLVFALSSCEMTSAQIPSTPYTEFTEQNQTIQGTVKYYDSTDVVRYITDNTDPTNIKTYIFYQENATTPDTYVPNVPTGWSTYEASYGKCKAKVPFDFSAPVTYILTEAPYRSVFIKIN